MACIKHVDALDAVGTGGNREKTTESTNASSKGCCLNPKGLCFSAPQTSSMKRTQTGRSRDPVVILIISY